jgi:hypothetical protein
MEGQVSLQSEKKGACVPASDEGITFVRQLSRRHWSSRLRRLRFRCLSLCQLLFPLLLLAGVLSLALAHFSRTKHQHQQNL